jgi:hypothetical protein
MLRCLLLHWPTSEQIFVDLVNNLFHQLSTVGSSSSAYSGSGLNDHIGGGVEGFDERYAECLYFLTVSLIESYHDSFGNTASGCPDSPPRGSNRLASAGTLFKAEKVREQESQSGQYWLRVAVTLLHLTANIPNVGSKYPLIAARFLDLCASLADTGLLSGEKLFLHHLYNNVSHIDSPTFAEEMSLEGAMVSCIPLICHCLQDLRLRLAGIKALLAMFSHHIHTGLSQQETVQVSHVLFTTICPQGHGRLYMDTTFFPKVCKCLGELLSTLLQSSMMMTMSSSSPSHGSEVQLLGSALAAFSAELQLLQAEYIQSLRVKAVKRCCTALAHCRICLTGLRYLLDALLFPMYGAGRRTMSDAEDGEEDVDNLPTAQNHTNTVVSGNATGWKVLSNLRYLDESFGLLCVQFMDILGSFVHAYTVESANQKYARIESGLSKVASAIAAIQSSVLDAGIRIPDTRVFLLHLQRLVASSPFPMNAIPVLLRSCVGYEHLSSQQHQRLGTEGADTQSPELTEVANEQILAATYFAHIKQCSHCVEVVLFGIRSKSNSDADNRSNIGILLEPSGVLSLSLEMLIYDCIDTFKIASLMLSKTIRYLLYCERDDSALSTPVAAVDREKNTCLILINLVITCGQMIGSCCTMVSINRHHDQQLIVPQSHHHHAHMSIFTKLLRIMGLFWNALCCGGSDHQQQPEGDHIRQSILVYYADDILTQLLYQSCFGCDVKHIIIYSGMIEVFVALLYVHINNTTSDAVTTEERGRSPFHNLLNRVGIKLSNVIQEQLLANTASTICPQAAETINELGMNTVLTMIMCTLYVHSGSLYGQASSRSQIRNQASIDMRAIIRKVCLTTRKTKKNTNLKGKAYDSDIVWST